MLVFRLFFAALFTVSCFAGDQPITWDMAFRGAEPTLTKATGYSDGWLDDRHFVWVERDDEGKPQYVKINAETGAREAYQKPDTRTNRRGLQTSADRKGEVWVEEDDLWYADLTATKVRRLTRSKGAERNPTFAPDGAWIGYTRDRNLYAMEIATGLEVQLTEDGSDTLYNGWASWVYFEEILGRPSRYRAFWWSPDSKKILFMRFDDSVVREFPIYHAGGNYGHLEVTRYPKAGEVNPKVKMGVVTIETGDIQWLDFDENADHYIAWPFWTPGSETIHVQWMNRDQNHLIIYDCDITTGKKQQIYEEKQDTWVEYFNDITYLEDGSGFILRSDKDGWRHLYLHGMDGKLKRRLTKGDWTVNRIEAIDLEAKKVYFTSRKDDTRGSDLHMVSLDGGDPVSLTKTEGAHRISLSPGLDYFLNRYSNGQTPATVSVHRNDGAKLHQIADAANPESDKYQTAKVEYFTVPTRDGIQMPAYWVVPENLDTSGATKYAVIFRIYSGPGSSTVRNAYNWSWRDHWYANNGVITISVDHRASGHFGKQGVANMYRKLGHWEVLDLSDAAAWLKEKPFIDPTRIGMVGHSYGGYMTLLALSKAPEHFTHGVSGAPVTDWSLYDTVYTERYMDTPQDNPDGYHDGSVMPFAKNMTGKLRLLHGDIDDNVHMQNSTQLVDVLTRENIQFEYMVYPNSRHGIQQRRHRADGENTFWFRYFLNREFGE